jgi:hypothetical protein
MIHVFYFFWRIDGLYVSELLFCITFEIEHCSLA